MGRFSLQHEDSQTTMAIKILTIVWIDDWSPASKIYSGQQWKSAHGTMPWVVVVGWWWCDDNHEWIQRLGASEKHGRRRVPSCGSDPSSWTKGQSPMNRRHYSLHGIPPSLFLSFDSSSWLCAHGSSPPWTFTFHSVS
jgi:hypothetical protein